MSVIFFLSIFTAFLFFCAFYVFSPKRNPKYAKLMERENAPSPESLKIVAVAFNGIAMLLTIGLVVAVPFLRAVGAIVMAGLVVRFFYRRLVCGPNSFSWTDQDPRPNTPDTAPAHVYESNTGEKPPGTGGGTSH